MRCIDVGNKIDEAGAEALLYALKDQMTLSQPAAVTKVTSVGLLRLCLQVF